MVVPRIATADDTDLLGSIAAGGFYDDPVMRWIFRDEAERLSKLTIMFEGLAEDTVPDRGLVHIADGVSAAFWRDPSFEHGRMAADRVEEATGGGEVPFSQDEMERLGILGEVMRENHPHEPHWYLNVVSTMPDRQGQGLGAATLQPILRRCDEDGVRAYLESTNPRNQTLYRRQGFVDAGEIQIPGGPPMMKMWREPSSSG